VLFDFCAARLRFWRGAGNYIGDVPSIPKCLAKVAVTDEPPFLYQTARSVTIFSKDAFLSTR
jgi:hypothetical protein